jgi:hypothetical protein
MAAFFKIGCSWANVNFVFWMNTVIFTKIAFDKMKRIHLLFVNNYVSRRF